MVQWADPDVVDNAAENWTDGQIACRINGHAWPTSGYGATGIVVSRYPNGWFLIRQSCDRGCGVIREAPMDPQGYLLNRWRMHYDKESGYLLRDADGQPVGRVDTDGQAHLRRRGYLGGARIIEVEATDA